MTELSSKKVMGIAILALLIGFIAYDTANVAYIVSLNATNITNNTFYNASNITFNNNSGSNTFNDVFNNYTTGTDNSSVNPYNLNADNLTSGKVPYQRLNVSLCNPANQASSFNSNTFNFDCVSIADSDPYILLTSESNLNVNSSVYCTGNACNYFNSSAFPNSTDFRNNSLAQRILSIELNLSNVTMITANGSIIASNLPDGFGNITNVSVSGGLIATYIYS